MAEYRSIDLAAHAALSQADDGTWKASIEEIDVHASGDTHEEMEKNLRSALMDASSDASRKPKLLEFLMKVSAPSTEEEYCKDIKLHDES